jgi:hypothetical protein
MKDIKERYVMIHATKRMRTNEKWEVRKNWKRREEEKEGRRQNLSNNRQKS